MSSSYATSRNSEVQIYDVGTWDVGTWDVGTWDVGTWDVGTCEERVFIAMEFVAGGTLREWQETRSISELLDTYHQTAQGLAAAHRAGLLHRDFKPDNVLIGTDGRPRVADFGLARGGKTEPILAGSSSRAEHSGSNPSSTSQSSIAGTPAYMAPEQRAGLPLDARADVYSFCVALFEALTGRLPYLTPSNGRDRTTPTPLDPSLLPRTLPKALVRTLVRGLSPAPEGRPASMDAIVSALEVRRVAPRRAVYIVTAGAIAMTLGLFPPKETDPCAEIPTLDTLVQPERLLTMARAFATQQPGYGSSTWNAIEPRIVLWSTHFKEVRSSACHSGTAKPVSRCLSHAATRFGAMLEIFESATTSTIDRAPHLLADLPDPGICAAETESTVPNGRAVRREVLALEERVTQLGEIVAADRGAEHRAEIDRVVREALEHDDLVLRARAMKLRALALEHGLRGTQSEAAAALEEAYFAELRAGLHGKAVETAALLVATYATDLGLPQESLEWYRHAKGLIEGHRVEGACTICLERNRSLALTAMGEHAEAEALLREQIEQVEAIPGGQASLMYADLLNYLGSVLLSRSEAEQARPLLARAVALQSELRGAEHPKVAYPKVALAEAHDRLGEHAKAERLNRESIETFTRIQGPNGSDLMALYNNLANSLGSQGRKREAIEAVEEALRVAQANALPDSQLSIPLHTLGNLHQDLGEFDEAESYYQRERAAVEASQGADHPDVGHPLHSLGRVALLRKDYAAAQEHFDRVLELWRNAYGPQHPLVAFPLNSLGELALARGTPSAALEPLGKALRIREASPETPKKLAQTRFLLARALWESGEDRRRALTLAEQAQRGYETLALPNEAREVLDWLATKR